MSDISIYENTPPALAALFAEQIGDDNSLTANISAGGFSVVSIKGSKFRVRRSGEEHMVVNEDGELVGSLQLAIIGASKHVSKTFYKSNYEEGSDAEPDCYSADGVAPAKDAAMPQCDTCAACPHNKFGSKITETGKKSKACGDAKRLAVVMLKNVPEGIPHEPMLLRVPAASLANLLSYGKTLQQRNVPFSALVTKVSFEHDPAYPKLQFQPARQYEAAELKVLEKIVTENKDMISNIIDQTLMSTETSAVSRKPVQEAQHEPEIQEEAAESKPDVDKMKKSASEKTAEKKVAEEKAKPKMEKVVDNSATIAAKGGDNKSAEDELNSILEGLD